MLCSYDLRLIFVMPLVLNLAPLCSVLFSFRHPVGCNLLRACALLSETYFLREPLLALAHPTFQKFSQYFSELLSSVRSLRIGCSQRSFCLLCLRGSRIGRSQQKKSRSPMKVKASFDLGLQSRALILTRRLKLIRSSEEDRSQCQP